MINVKEINEYIEFVNKYPDKTNKWVKLLIKNVTTPTINDDDIFFDSVMFNKCIAYIEKYYFKLFLFQKFKIAHIFMFKNNQTVFNTFITLMGRGNGKTSLDVAICNFLQTDYHGIKNYHVDIIANNEDQAIKDFNISYDMLEENELKFKNHFEWTKTKIKNKRTLSEMRYNTSNAKTKDGKEGGALLYDELHQYENYEQINVFDSQLGKIKHARKFIASTQGFIRGGVLDDYLGECENILLTGDNPMGWFPFLFMLEDIKEVDIPEAWIKANPTIEERDVLKNQIMKDWIEQKKFPDKRTNFIVKRMNLVQNRQEEGAATWDEIKATNQPIPYDELRGKECICGIDYANTNDFVGCCLVFIENEKVYAIHHSFICSRSRDLQGIKPPLRDWENRGYCTFVEDVEIKPEVICEWISMMSLEYDIKRVVIDRFRHTLFSYALSQIGFTAPTSYKERKKLQTAGERLIDLTMTNEIIKIIPVISSLFANHNLVFGDDPMMRWYCNNTKKIPLRNGNFNYGKIEPHYRKTDGFMAFVGAMSIAYNLFHEQEENKDITSYVKDIPVLFI